MSVNLLEAFEKKYITDLNKEMPTIKAGYTISVHLRIVEGAASRVQIFTGLVLRVKNRGLGSSFLIRKDSHGEGVERNFLKYSPMIEKIEIVKRGRVRRAKLYYMRTLKGKAARIREL